MIPTRPSPPTIAALLLLVVLAALSLRRAPLDPTLAEVRVVLDDYVEDFSMERESLDSLESWGDDVLPALRKIASRKTDYSYGSAVVASVTSFNSVASVDFLLELLRGESSIDPETAFDRLWMMASDLRHRPLLHDHPTFQAEAFRFVDASAEGYDSAATTFARIAQEMQWEEAIPRLESMLRDEDQSLRVLAAEAIASLTGAPVEAAMAPAHFPRSALVPGLVLGPIRLKTDLPGRADFGIDEAGQPRIFRSTGKGLRSIDPDGKLVPQVALPHHCRGVLVQSWGGPRFLTLAAEGPWGDGQSVVGVHGDGTLAWDFAPQNSMVTDLAPIHFEQGEPGVIVAGDTNLTALDANGDVLWSRDEFTPTYSLLTHADLPGELFTVFGSFTRFHAVPGKHTLVKGYIRPGHYATRAVLFPDARGEPALISTGSGEHSIPHLSRIDAQGNVAWTSTLPADASKLAMVEPPGKPRLFLTALDSGKLLILDGQGTLIHESELPSQIEPGRTLFYGFCAGEIAPGKWAIYVSMLEGTYLLPLDLSKL